MKEHIKNQSFRSGNEVWKIPRLLMLAKELKPFKIPMKHFNIHNLCPEIATIREFVYHIDKVLEADMSYPIILDDDGYVMDGRHRVAKALLEKRKHILAVRFKETPRCCYTQEDHGTQA